MRHIPSFCSDRTAAPATVFVLYGIACLLLGLTDGGGSLTLMGSVFATLGILRALGHRSRRRSER